MDKILRRKGPPAVPKRKYTKTHYKLDGEILQIELKDRKWCTIQLDKSQLHHIKRCIEEREDKTLEQKDPKQNP